MKTTYVLYDGTSEKVKVQVAETVGKNMIARINGCWKTVNNVRIFTFSSRGSWTIPYGEVYINIGDFIVEFKS